MNKQNTILGKSEIIIIMESLSNENILTIRIIMERKIPTLWNVFDRNIEYIQSLEIERNREDTNDEDKIIFFFKFGPSHTQTHRTGASGRLGATSSVFISIVSQQYQPGTKSVRCTRFHCHNNGIGTVCRITISLAARSRAFVQGVALHIALGPTQSVCARTGAPK